MTGKTVLTYVYNLFYASILCKSGFGNWVELGNCRIAVSNRSYDRSKNEEFISEKNGFRHDKLFLSCKFST